MPKQELAEYLDDFVRGIHEFGKTKGIQYDLIHSHYWMSGLAANDLKREWNVPVIHMFHTLGVMKQRVARPGEEAEGDYRLQGERQVLRIANKVIAATPAELAQLQWLYQADTPKIVVIPPGVDLDVFRPIPQAEALHRLGDGPEHRMILFVGRMDPIKGLDTLVHAVARLLAF